MQFYYPQNQPPFSHCMVYTQKEPEEKIIIKDLLKRAPQSIYNLVTAVQTLLPSNHQQIMTKTQSWGHVAYGGLDQSKQHYIYVATIDDALDLMRSNYPEIPLLNKMDY